MNFPQHLPLFKRLTQTLLVEKVANLDLSSGTLREKVLRLVEIGDAFANVSKALIPSAIASSATERIRYYFQQYPGIVIASKEVAVIAGISEYARRIRELRVEEGWKIISGKVLKESALAEEETMFFGGRGGQTLKPDEYVLVSEIQDKETAFRWGRANKIRKEKTSLSQKLLKFLLENVGENVSGEELRYVANNSTEWARRLRELRTQEGYQIFTKFTGRPDLGQGIYVLESTERREVHDRKITEVHRREVLERDKHTCQSCGWNGLQWTKEDPRFLELHHIKMHSKGGPNTPDNLETLCNKCHDRRHSELKNDGN